MKITYTSKISPLIDQGNIKINSRCYLKSFPYSKSLTALAISGYKNRFYDCSNIYEQYFLSPL